MLPPSVSAPLLDLGPLHIESVYNIIHLVFITNELIKRTDVSKYVVIVVGTGRKVVTGRRFDDASGRGIDVENRRTR